MNGTFRPTLGNPEIRTRLRGQTTRFLARFVRAEDGVMLSLVVFMLLIMMIVAGIGVEITRTEMESDSLRFFETAPEKWRSIWEPTTI